MSKGIIKNTLIYSIGEVVPKLLGFILLPIYTYYLSPSDYGIISYTSAVMIFLPVFSTLCLNSFLIRFFFERGTKIEQQKLVGNIFFFIALLNSVIFISGYYFIPRLINIFHVNVPWEPYFKLALIAYFLDVFSIIPLVYYRVHQNAIIFVALNLGKVILQYVVILILIVFYKKGILGYYYGNVIALLPFLVLYWIIMFKKTILNLNLKIITEGLRFSLPLCPGVLAYFLIGFSDRILLEQSVSMSEIGIYNIAFTVAFSLNMIITSVYRAIEPEIFQRYNTAGFDSFIDKSKAIFFSIIYISAMFVSLFSQEIFYLMAPENYFKGYLFVPVIMIGVIMTGQNIIFGGILTAEKNTKVIGLTTLLGVIVNITFNLFFIPKYGAFAAAISTAISFGIINIVLYLNIKIKKSFQQEVIALIFFLVIVITIFFIFDIEFSFSFTVFKALLFIFYSVLIQRIFNIKLNSILLEIKDKVRL